MKKLTIPFLCVAAFLWFIGIAYARITYYPSGDAEGLGQGNTLMSSQIAWNVLDSTTAADNEVTDLGATERTYLTVLAAIAAASSSSDGDGEITITRIPPTWNAIRFRNIAKTGGSITQQIYLGTLGNGTDCEFAKAGQLVWTTGAQASTVTDYLLADEVAVTAYCWNKSWGSQSPVSDLVAEATIDVLGADLVMVVTTVTNVDCKLLGKGI